MSLWNVSYNVEGCRNYRLIKKDCEFNNETSRLGVLDALTTN